MKLLAICQYYYPENFTIYKICEQLVKLGHDVTVLTAKPNYGYGKIIDGYENVDYEEINGVKVRRLTIYPRKRSRFSVIRNYLSFWSKSKKWVKKCKEQFDIVYSMSLSPVTILAAGNLYKKKHHVKHVVHCVDLWPESVLVTKAIRKHSLEYRLIYHWSKKLYQHADKILVGSPSYEDYFRNVLKIIDTPIEYAPQCSLNEVAEAAYQYDDKYFNILYCGNIGLLQKIELLPEVMKELTDTNIKMHIIGMGPMAEALTQKINEYKLDNIVFHGPIPSKKACEYFVNADAIYISLDGEGYVGKTIPNKLQMAMCFAKPIIAALNGDGKTIVDNSKCGVTCNLEISAISNAFKHMCNLENTKLKNMSKIAHEYYCNNFAIEKSIKVVEKSLLDLID